MIKIDVIMNILERIIHDKKAEVCKNLTYISKKSIGRNNTDTRQPLDFKTALKRKGLALIAEIKKASPSKGIIRPDFNPLEIAQSYQKNEAACISILTEEKYFQGNPKLLPQIRKLVSIPLLRKDFIIDERQVRESYDLEADAILLIVAALSPDQLNHLLQIAGEFELTCLVEVHTLDELAVALEQKCELIGINNRNLSSFNTDIGHSIKLKKHIPKEVTCVSESGIKTAEDCKLLHTHGFEGVLVGETLMKHSDPGAHIPELLKFSR